MSSRDDVHGALNIEPDGGFAAEEGGNSKNGNQLPIPFRSIVGFAQHLAVGDAGSAAFAPCGHMGSIHLLEFPYFGAGGIMTESTQRTVRLASRLYCY